MQPLISVIVPVYKVEAYLDRCVESIVSQTYQNLEIILVDDGSPDNCGRMCDEWAKKDSRIQVIHKENGGLSDARNAGMAVASGEYIGFVDSDDWIDRLFLETLHDCIQTTGSDIAACGIHTFYEGDADLPAASDAPDAIYCTEEAMRLLIANQLRQVVWNKLYKRQMMADIPFAVGKLHEDEFWSYQVIARAQHIAVSAYSGYHYFQRGESIMGVCYAPRRLDAVEAKVLRQAYLEEHFPQISSYSRVDLVFTCIYHGQKVLTFLKGAEKNNALRLLRKTIGDFPLDKADKGTLRITHKLWYLLAKNCFVMTCRVRNLLHIGV